jgi:hypothetical protein
VIGDYIMEKKFRYKYVIDEEHRTVVCLSSFAGQTVRGVARCSPNDVWDVDIGKMWAEARCAAKIAHKRLRRAEDMVKGTTEGLRYFTEQVAKYKQYETDALDAVKMSTARLAELEKTLK